MLDLIKNAYERSALKRKVRLTELEIVDTGRYLIANYCLNGRVKGGQVRFLVVKRTGQLLATKSTLVGNGWGPIEPSQISEFTDYCIKLNNALGKAGGIMNTITISPDEKSAGLYKVVIVTAKGTRINRNLGWVFATTVANDEAKRLKELGIDAKIINQ